MEKKKKTWFININDRYKDCYFFIKDSDISKQTFKIGFQNHKEEKVSTCRYINESTKILQ